MPVYNHYYPNAGNRISTLESAQRLALEGPTIPVAVSVTEDHARVLHSLGLSRPPAVSGLALVDTGASICSVDESVIQRLGIPPFGYTPVAGATGTSDQSTYPASLSFPGTSIPNITFFDFRWHPLASLGIIVLIGRNVLRHFVLVYNGPGGHVSLSF